MQRFGSRWARRSRAFAHPAAYDVIARSGAKKQSRASRMALDWFASLAMTMPNETRTDGPSRHFARRIHLRDDFEHIGGRARAAEIKPLRGGAAGLAHEL